MVPTTCRSNLWRGFCIILSLGSLLFIFQSNNAQESQLSRDEFNSELRNALFNNKEEAINSLIRGHRLYVKPLVDGLIKESISNELKGNSSASWQASAAAIKAATVFENLFGEKSLSIAVSYLTEWSPEQKEKKLMGDSLYALGTKFRTGNESELAIEYLNSALDVYRSIKDLRGEAEVLGGIGATYYNNLGDYEQSLKYYKDALMKREEVDDKALIGNSLNSLGSVYSIYLSDYPISISYYEKAEMIRIEIGDLAGLRTTLRYKSVAYVDMAELMIVSGKYPEAMENLENALSIRKELGLAFDVAETLSQMGFVYSKLGDYNTAVEKLSQAASIMKNENDSIGLAGVFNHFGIVLHAAGRTERALEYYNNAIWIYENQNDPEDLLPVLNNLGALYFDLKDYAHAEEYHRRGLNLSMSIGAKDTEGEYLLNLANDKILQGKLDESLLDYLSALELASSLNNPDLAWRIIVGMAENYERRGDIEKSVELNDSALVMIERIRKTIDDDDLKAFYLAKERYVFEDLTDMFGKMHEIDSSKGYDRKAFAYSEQSKSRVLLDLLAELSGEESPASGIVSLDEAQSLCPDKNTVILNYSVGDSSSCMWIITSKGHRLFMLPGRARLQEIVETMRFALTDPEQGSVEFITKPGYALYQMLIEPAEAFLKKKSRLIIMPDGILNYLPFEALVTENIGSAVLKGYAELPFLVKKYPVSYVQSASVLRSLIDKTISRKKAKPDKRSLVAFGDPVYGNTKISQGLREVKLNRLEYSGKEVEAIASYFKEGECDIFLGVDATEDNLKNSLNLQHAGYLHFATHGIINEDKPALSSLVLARNVSSTEDGLLQANEISDLSLNADLVVLSACQTGLGKIIRGEGIIGLTRAFMYAGTPSVLASLWSVSDNSTSELMTEFYKNLIPGKLDKTDALRKAQLKLMSEEKFAHPFYWAPFIIIGDWR